MNLYTALRFHGRDDLHLTLTYMRGADPDVVIPGIDALVKLSGAHRFRMTFDERPRMFGAERNVRVLLPSVHEPLPVWTYLFAPATWTPHVTCEDDTLPPLEVEAVALMHRAQELRRWVL